MGISRHGSAITIAPVLEADTKSTAGYQGIGQGSLCKGYIVGTGQFFQTGKLFEIAQGNSGIGKPVVPDVTIFQLCVIRREVILQFIIPIFVDVTPNKEAGTAQLATFRVLKIVIVVVGRIRVQPTTKLYSWAVLCCKNGG